MNNEKGIMLDQSNKRCLCLPIKGRRAMVENFTDLDFHGG